MHESSAIAARAIGELPGDRRTLVAVDGLDGAGKTTFADALAGLVDRPVVRASVDDFHNPRAFRYRRGRDSPEGFYMESFDLSALTDLLLAPFAAGERFRLRAFDHEADMPVDSDLRTHLATRCSCWTASSCTGVSCGRGGICRFSSTCLRRWPRSASNYATASHQVVGTSAARSSTSLTPNLPAAPR